MRRLLRRVFNVAAAVSSVLFLAACALWVRSGFVTDYASRIPLRPTGLTVFAIDYLLSEQGRITLGGRRIAALPAIPGGRLKDWRQQRAAVEARLNRYQAAMSPRLSHWRTASATYAHNVLPPRPDQPGVEDGPHLPGIGYRSTASGFRDLWGYSGTYTDHDFAIHYGWVAAVTGLLPAVVLPRSLRRFRTDRRAGRRATATPVATTSAPRPAAAPNAGRRPTNPEAVKISRNFQPISRPLLGPLLATTTAAPASGAGLRPGGVPGRVEWSMAESNCEPDSGKDSSVVGRAPGHAVFLSYSSHDQRVADAVCSALEGRGVRCWMAPRDIRPGADWALRSSPRLKPAACSSSCTLPNRISRSKWSGRSSGPSTTACRCSA